MADFDLELQGMQGVLDELDDLEERWTGPERWVVGTAVNYSIYLEMGTRHMDPKPFFRPALSELRMQGIGGFIAHNTRTNIDEIDDIGGLVRKLAFALERRIKEIITAKGLIETGTLRASVKAVPGTDVSQLPTAEDINADAAADFEVTA